MCFPLKYHHGSILPFPELYIHESLSFHLSPPQFTPFIDFTVHSRLVGIEGEGAAVLESEHLDVSTHLPRRFTCSRNADI